MLLFNHTLIICLVCHLILKSHQMALFSFLILHKDFIKGMLILVFFSTHAAASLLRSEVMFDP